jgi:four helix bundle protein
MRIEKFEEIRAWMEARELVKEIYHGFQDCRDFSFKDQIQRAGISIMSNIAEGFDRNTNKEFIDFLLVARGSCAETRSLLYAALDIGYIEKDAFDYMSGRTNKISGLINGFISYLKTNPKAK